MFKPQELERRRREIYCAAPEYKIHTFAQAARFIRRVGFAWLFYSAKGPALPSLFEALHGKRGLQINDWDEKADLVWAWKNDFPAARRAYYGKVLAGKPAVIACEMLPPLYAHKGEESFAEVYARGGISYESKRVYEALLQNGPMPVIALRRAAGLDTRGGQSRYHRALDELQRRFFILPMGATQETGAWPSQIMDLFTRWFPEVVAEAHGLDGRAARLTLADKYLRTVIAAPPRHLAHLFGFTREELAETITDLGTARWAREQDGWIVTRRRV